MKVKYAVFRLKIKQMLIYQEKQKLMVSAEIDSSDKDRLKNEGICTNKITRGNLIATCVLWSTNGFITYCLIYYSKYFDGNFYINYAI